MEPREIKAEELRELLAEGHVVSFSFTKKDGTERTMIGTTNRGFIPEEKIPSGKRTVPDNQIAVFDLDSNGWRSVLTNTRITLRGIPNPAAK